MAILWYLIVAVMLAAYVVLDGFDLGAGALHMIVAHTDAERRRVIASIGPLWDGNEVWLLAAGGALYFAFPQLYASSFSGFYLPLIMVLWLIILRGISIEFRSHLQEGVWRAFFDGVFGVASLLLAIFYGAALGNVVRGVPLAADHYFFLPLWTDWRVGPHPGVLDWYTVFSGVLALVALVVHGAHWVSFKTDGELQQRTRTAAAVLAPVLGLLTLLHLVATLSIQPSLLHNFQTMPAGYILPAGVFASVAAMIWLRARGNDLGAFLSSAAYLVFMLVAMVFAVFPMVLPATDPAQSLTIWNSVTSDYGMRVALAWWIPGIILVAAYFVFTYRSFRGKASSEDGHGY
jgi:cytochrome d ubiquinol oxidase subunit II